MKTGGFIKDGRWIPCLLGSEHVQTCRCQPEKFGLGSFELTWPDNSLFSYVLAKGFVRVREYKEYIGLTGWKQEKEEILPMLPKEIKEINKPIRYVRVGYGK